MKIERTIFILLLIFISCSVSAQEKLMPVMPLTQDSAQIELERKIMYRQLLSGTLETGGMIQNLEIPKFDFNAAVTQYYNFGLNDLNYISAIFNFNNNNSFGFFPSPFFRNGTVFSAASYKLNDKFKIGGYSFGANSIFSAPLPNQGMNNFETRGATMFMQYKVSKNFKIETRVSVTHDNGQGF